MPGVQKDKFAGRLRLHGSRRKLRLLRRMRRRTQVPKAMTNLTSAELDRLVKLAAGPSPLDCLGSLFRDAAPRFDQTIREAWAVNEKIRAHWQGVSESLVEARAEIDRLKLGDFTEEEFQNLCHRFSPDDAARFKAGCEDYQRKLFGEEK